MCNPSPWTVCHPSPARTDVGQGQAVRRQVLIVDKAAGLRASVKCQDVTSFGRRSVGGDLSNAQTSVGSPKSKQSTSAAPALATPPIPMPRNESNPVPPSSGGVNVSNNSGNTQVAVNSPGAQQTINVHAPLSRKLSSEQRLRLVSLLRQFAGSKIDVVAPLGDGESQNYAHEFIALFREAGLDAGPNEGLNQAVWSKLPQGIEVTMNEADARAGRVPPLADALIRGLVEVKLLPDLRAFVNPQTPPEKVEFRVGPR